MTMEIAFIDISYNPPANQTTYEARNMIQMTMHNIQQRQRSQAFTRVHMVTEDIKGNRTVPILEVRCKIDTGTGAKIMPICVQEVVSCYI